MTGLRVAFTTLGCKVNQSETDLLARQFAAAGYECVPFEGAADVYVVNTCTVTHVADRKSRQLLNQARRANPEALIVATGCYASVVGQALAAERTMVVRNRDKDTLLALVDGRLNRHPGGPPTAVDLEKYLDVPTPVERTRAMVKVQDGCDSHCTYCIIPRSRGRSRSLPPEQVVRRVRALAREGHAEVVITGVDLGSYGEDDPALPDLGGLVRHILEETDVSRVRLSSLEPGDFKEDWLSLWADSRLCRHLHVPLQAGNEAVLRRMERKYSPADFRRMVTSVRAAIAGVTLTTDVMAGFPGETDGEFEEGYDFIRSLQFDGMHVFKYSQRSGTRAARMPDQVDERLKDERSRKLRDEAAAGLERLIARHLGRVASTVWEEQRDGVWRGTTDTNVRAYGAPERSRRGSIGHVRLTAPFRDGVWCEPAHEAIPLLAAAR